MEQDSADSTDIEALKRQLAELQAKLADAEQARTERDRQEDQLRHQFHGVARRPVLARLLVVLLIEAPHQLLEHNVSETELRTNSIRQQQLLVRPCPIGGGDRRSLDCC